MPDTKALGDKGACNFVWGPGCQGDTSPDGNHKCLKGKGHDGQCECWYCKLRTNLNSSRERV